MRFAFELKGMSGILFHADDVLASDRLSEWRKDPANKDSSVAGDDRSPAWTYQEYLYWDEALGNDSVLSVPSGNLMVALRQAGSQIILKKQKTMKEITQSGMVIPHEFLIFLAAGREVPMSFFWKMKGKRFAEQADTVRSLGGGSRLFMKRARVGQSKHVRVRLRVDDWVARGLVEVTAPEIAPERLKDLFRLAGNIGLCDWRPGCKTPGPFGMFTSKVWQVKPDWTWKDHKGD